MPKALSATLSELATHKKSWLVTGAAGFIGSHLCESLLRAGQRVVGLDNFATGRRENLLAVERELASPAEFAHFSLIEGDICDLELCMRASAGVDVILHQAALGSVPRSIAKPLDSHRANVDGTFNVFLAAIENEIPRVVYASSSSVYGDDAELPKQEARIGRPLSPYAATKRIDEIYAGVLGKSHRLDAVGLRYFNVIGARQNPNGPYAAVVPRWVSAMAAGERPLIFGDGETTRDFCPVQNVVQANILAAVSHADLAGRVYNIALGGRTSLNELYRLIRDGMAARGHDCAGLEPEYGDFRPGDVRHTHADISAAQRDFGYAPSTDLVSGLESVLDEFSAQAGPG